jgi:hypothetical protein
VILPTSETPNKEGDMKRLVVIAALAAAAAYAAGAWSAPSATPTEKKLQRDVAALKTQVKALQKSLKTVKKDVADTQVGVGAVAILVDCVAAVSADEEQGSWQVTDQISTATQAGKTYFGPQPALSDQVAGVGPACQTLGITRSQVVPPVITPFDSILALFRS